MIVKMWTIFFHDNTFLTTHYEKPEKSGNLKFNSKGQGIRLKSEGNITNFPKSWKKGNFVSWNSFLANLRILILKFSGEHTRTILLWGSQ